MLLLFVVLILVGSVQSSEGDKGYNALHFGTSSSDYVNFSFDMSPFRDSLSICTWIKHLHTSPAHPTVFHYSYSGNWEIYITSNGQYTYVVEDGGLNSLKSKFTTPSGMWFSLCLTWSLSSRTSKLYLDGELVGTDQTSSGRSLQMGGTLMLGRRKDSSTSNGVFGGQVYNFNMFSEVLNAAAIKKIAGGGLCSDLEEFSETRILRWEDILDRSRSGSVSEVTVCAWRKKFVESQERLADAVGRLNETETELRMMKEQFETLTGQLNRTEDKLETVSGQLNSTQVQLGAETAERNKTVEQLETCSATLTDTQTELDGTRKFENITRWDVLYTAPYFNKVFTDELYEQLTSSWDMLRKFVGTNITEGIIGHFQHYHNEHECDIFEQLSWPTMLKQFVGVELTNGMIDHFRQRHEESPCDNTTES